MMFKRNMGSIGPEDGSTMIPIIVKSNFPIKTGYAIVGGISLAVSLGCLIFGAFYKGAESFSDAEVIALEKAGVIKDIKGLLFDEK